MAGASVGLGVELARELCRRGYGVTLVARSEDRLLDLAAELGAQAEVQALDLADEHARVRLIERVGRGDREVVGLCNNVGFGTLGAFVTQDVAREQVMLRLNVAAVHHLTATFLPGMVGVGVGAVLNVAPAAGARPGMATYAATMAFVRAFSQALHREVSGTGVSVTALCPPRGSADAACAKTGVDAMVEGRRAIVPTTSAAALGRLGGRLVPRSLLPNQIT